MAAESRILPTSGGGFGASDNGLHRGAIPERAAVFSAVCTVRRMPGKLVPRDLWRCPAGRPILLHNSVGLGTRVAARAAPALPAQALRFRDYSSIGERAVPVSGVCAPVTHHN